MKRYGARIAEWRKNELEAIDGKTRKLLTTNRSLHHRADVDRLYWKKNNDGKGLISVQECVRIEKTSLGFYLKEQEQQLLTKVVMQGVISDDENPKDVKTQLLQQRKESYALKRMHSPFMRCTEEVRDDSNSWLWMKKGYLKKETQGLIMTAQDQSFQTR